LATEPLGRYRPLSGAVGLLVKGLAILLVVLGALYAVEIHLWLGIAIFRQQFLGLVLGLVLAILFLLLPATRRHDRGDVSRYDLVLAALGLVCGLYVAIWYPKIANRLSFPTADKYVLGTIAILLVLEICRRIYGLVLPLIAAAFVFYAYFADYFPGVLATKGIAWPRLAGDLFLSPQGMLGLPMEILTTIVLVFVLFGELMYAAGGGQLFSDLAVALMGRFRGGPAKVAVLASALFGSISGSAVANVMVDGAFTIPLMKRTGYRPEVAAAVEATASTGGLIMPPVMGAVAFLVAEYLNISYGEVVLAATIPALLYYGAILVQVDLEAGRAGMKGLPPDQIPKLGVILRERWPFLLPLPALVWTLVALYWQPGRSGMLAVLMVVVLAFWYVKGMSLRWWLDVLAKAGIAAAEVIVIGALVGLIVGPTDFTGLGFSLTLPLLQIGEANFLLFLVITALMSLILGMGLPGIAIYIMQAALIVPALVKMGIAPIAAHFFIMFFGTFSLLTPPVAIAAMAAAAIGNADPMKTGWEASKLAVIAYIVPFMFVLSPSLLFQGDPIWIVIDGVTAGIGVLAIGVGLRGFFFDHVGLVNRALLLLSAVALLLPATASRFAWEANIAALLVTAVILVGNYRQARRRREATEAVAA